MRGCVANSARKNIPNLPKIVRVSGNTNYMINTFLFCLLWSDRRHFLDLHECFLRSWHVLTCSPGLRAITVTLSGSVLRYTATIMRCSFTPVREGQPTKTRGCTFLSALGSWAHGTRWQGEITLWCRRSTPFGCQF